MGHFAHFAPAVHLYSTALNNQTFLIAAFNFFELTPKLATATASLLWLKISW